ncbi:techylectin-5A [Nephila pilipes]|uniref:Techylectin-5A n=1 Tax=Nephila pilipes TaxID=299642 RepID=A0A8X6P9A9_NEPPI|nr:techylectin-5A [Nephila pilipes]
MIRRIFYCFTGNDYIFALTNQRLYSVRFDLWSVDGRKVHALYDTFWIDDEIHKYALHIKGYSGDAVHQCTKTVIGDQGSGLGITKLIVQLKAKLKSYIIQIKRNLNKIEWKHFTDLMENLVKDIPNNLTHYQETSTFSEVLKRREKQNIPKGRTFKYKPFWNEDLNAWTTKFVTLCNDQVKGSTLEQKTLLHIPLHQHENSSHPDRILQYI